MSKSRTLLSRTGTMTIGAVVALSGLAASVSSAQDAIRVTQRERVAMTLEGKPAFVELQTPGSAMSYGYGDTLKKGTRLLFSNKVVVRTENPEALRGYVDSMARSFKGIEIEGRLGESDAWVVVLGDVRSAVRFTQEISSQGWVRAANIDQGIVPDFATLYGFEPGSDISIEDLRELRDAHRVSRGDAVSLDGVQQPAGGPDPLAATLFYHTNTAIATFRNDNNIPATVYDTMGYTGSGVNVGIARYQFTNHIDRTHEDTQNNFDAVLSMPVDLTLEPDNYYLTFLSGIIAAERSNGLGAHGVAPSAGIAGLGYGTDLQVYNMLTYMNNAIDVKFVPLFGDFLDTDRRFIEGGVSDYLNDGFENALRFGRQRKGQIFVFNGGVYTGNMDADDAAFPPQTPDFYNEGGIGDLYTATNEVVIFTQDDGGGMWDTTTGPHYIRAQSNLYQPAADRRTFLINAVDENLVPDINQAFGPAVFASVISSTSNLSAFWDDVATPPAGNIADGITGPIPGDAYFTLAGIATYPGQTDGMTPADPDWFFASQSSGAVGAGIIALMLEANPNLTIRDIQHILFESTFESTRSESITYPGLDTVNQGYMIPPPLGYSGDGTEQSHWQANAALLDSPSGPRAVRHSDYFGFGIIDAELAISKAANWGGSGRLFLLDSGLVGSIGLDAGGGMGDDTGFEGFDITDAEFITGDNSGFVNPGGAFVDATNQINICVRDNIQVETVVVELTIEGDSHNDLWIELVSPNGTRSNLLIPVSDNPSGTTFDMDLTDDEADNGYRGIAFGGTNYALYRHKLTSFKHWGELSGGRWQVNFYDYGPDEAMEEGDGMSDMMGSPFTTTLGPFGVPGSSFRGGKMVSAYRIQIYGTDTGELIFDACDPRETNCPGDLNGDGIVNTADMNTYISWYLNGDARADLNDSGSVDFLDLTFWVSSLYQPGFCTIGGSNRPFVGNRPTPGRTDVDDNNPVTRPI